MRECELAEWAGKIRREGPEGQTVELRPAHDGAPLLVDTLSSFSNQDEGGIILFGIDGEHSCQFVGVYDPQDLRERVLEQCSQMEPPVQAVFTSAEVDGVILCAAEIPPVDLAERPCYYRGAGRVKGSFLRVGDADLPMTDYELYSLEAYRKNLHDDERPVERANLGELDSKALNGYLKAQRKNRPGLSGLSDEAAYELMNITRSGVPTLAAVMNFGIYPQGYFPQLCITAISIPGNEIGDTAPDNARFTDNRRIEGTIPEMIEEAQAFCMRNMKFRTIIDPETGKRTDRMEYPAAAVREAVLNAMIHRDYSAYTEGTPVQIDFFTDRLEIHSPGCLYGRMRPDQLGHARPEIRNPVLAGMTEALTGAGKRYSGIPAMRKAMREYGLPEPVFENRRDEFVVTFYNQPAETCPAGRRESGPEHPSFKEQSEALLEFCEVPRSRQEIAVFLGARSRYDIYERYIRPLVAAGMLALTVPEKPKSKYQKYYTLRP